MIIKILEKSNMQNSHKITVLIMISVVIIPGLTLIPNVDAIFLSPIMQYVDDNSISTKILEFNGSLDTFTPEETDFPSDLDLIISQLPRVGDTIDITFNVIYDLPYSDTYENAKVVFNAPDTLEFVVVPDGFDISYVEPQSLWGVDYPGMYTVKGSTTFESGVIQKFTATVKAVKEGETNMVLVQNGDQITLIHQQG